MNEALAKALGIERAHAIKARINGDKNHGWGIDDSAEVIDAIVAKDAEMGIEALLAAKKDPKSWSLSEEAMGLIKGMINPSQVRQKFETAGFLAESKREKKNKAEDAALAEIMGK